MRKRSRRSQRILGIPGRDGWEGWWWACPRHGRVEQAVGERAPGDGKCEKDGEALFLTGPADPAAPADPAGP